MWFLVYEGILHPAGGGLEWFPEHMTGPQSRELVEKQVTLEPEKACLP